MQSSAKRRIVLFFVGEVIDVYKQIVLGQEQYLGEHQRGQDGGGLRPFRNNSLQSSLQKFLDPGMYGSSDAVPKLNCTK